MRELSVSKFVPSTPSELDRLLDPRQLIEYEGSFSVEAVEQGDSEQFVTASGPGLTVQYRFEQRPDGWYYEQAGEAGPFEAMETTVTVDREMYRSNRPNLKWHDEYGDRRTELVFIGTDYDESELRAGLSAALLTETEQANTDLQSPVDSWFPTETGVETVVRMP